MQTPFRKKGKNATVRDSNASKKNQPKKCEKLLKNERRSHFKSVFIIIIAVVACNISNRTNSSNKENICQNQSFAILSKKKKNNRKKRKKKNEKKTKNNSSSTLLYEMNFKNIVNRKGERIMSFYIIEAALRGGFFVSNAYEI